MSYGSGSGSSAYTRAESYGNNAIDWIPIFFGGAAHLKVRAAIRYAQLFLFSIITSGCLSGIACGALANAPVWSAKPYSYVLINQDVRDALKEFGRNLNIPILLSDKVGGRVRGEVRADTAGAFLTKLAEANGLIWYYDGSILYINSSEEFATQIISLGRADGQRVIDEIKRLNLMDERFSIKSTPKAPALRVSGTPAFVAMVQQVIAAIQPPPPAGTETPRVRVFRGGKLSELVEDTAQSDSATVARKLIPARQPLQKDQSGTEMKRSVE